MRGVGIKIEDLGCAYGSTAVLHGVNLEIEPGEFVALLGASGCGKTTLLRGLSGFITPVSGRISLDGQDITSLPPEKRNMAMVFQSYALWPHMTVAQNIGYGLRLRRRPSPEIASKVEHLAAMLGLGELVNRKPPQLSGGQRQRVALGRALAIDPPVLLLDEPLSNLDARIRLAMRHEIRALQKRLGITAVHVTHDREEAMVMADRIVIINEGRIAQVGPPTEVYERPANAFVAAFMGAENEIVLPAHKDGDCAVFQTDLGDSKLPLSPRLGRAGVQWCAGDETAVLIRFRSGECALSAGNGQAGDGLRIAGTIRYASYPGGSYRYTVETRHGALMIDSPRLYREGDAVIINLPAQSLHVYSRSEVSGP